MGKTIKEEIETFKRLSGLLKEDQENHSELFADIRKLFRIASDDMKEKDIFKKLKNFFDDIFSFVDYSESKSDIDFTTKDDDFYSSILDCISAPKTKDNLLFFYAWRQAEGGEAMNNPFNTTKKQEGATLYGNNVAGVKNYPTANDGIKATCETLKLPYYTDIVNGLKNDVGLYKLSRMESLEKWGTGDLLAKVADSYLSGSTPKPKEINIS